MTRVTQRTYEEVLTPRDRDELISLSPVLDETKYREYRLAARERWRKYYAQNRDREIARQRQKKKAEPKERRAARERFSRAVKMGVLIPPLSCSLCHRVSKVYGHHLDYSKPLEIVWLCGRCHKAQHPARYE